MNNRETLDDTIEVFLTSIAITNTGSNHTLLAYRADIMQFLDYESDIRKVNKDCLNSFILYLRETSIVTNRTICRKLSSLRSFFGWMLRNNLISENPFINYKNPKIFSKIPDFLFLDELLYFFDNIPTDSFTGIRNRVMFELMYACGLRVSEMTSLCISDINFNDSVVLIKGKGNIERIVPFYDDIKDKLIDYIQHSRHQLLGKESNQYVFLNRYGKKLSPQGVNYILEELDKETGLNRRLHSHIFRHSFATHLLDNGADLRIIQCLLGHQNISTTQIYTHVTQSQIKRIYDSTHPRAICSDSSI